MLVSETYWHWLGDTVDDFDDRWKILRSDLLVSCDSCFQPCCMIYGGISEIVSESRPMTVFEQPLAELGHL